MKRKLNSKLLFATILSLLILLLAPSTALASQKLLAKATNKDALGQIDSVTIYKYDKYGTLSSIETQHYSNGKKDLTTKRKRTITYWPGTKTLKKYVYKEFGTTFTEHYNKKGLLTSIVYKENGKGTVVTTTYKNNGKYLTSYVKKSGGKKVASGKMDKYGHETSCIIYDDKGKVSSKSTITWTYKKGVPSKAVFKSAEGTSTETYDSKGNLKKIVSNYYGTKNTFTYTNTYSGNYLTKVVVKRGKEVINTTTYTYTKKAY